MYFLNLIYFGIFECYQILICFENLNAFDDLNVSNNKTDVDKAKKVDVPRRRSYTTNTLQAALRQVRMNAHTFAKSCFHF